MNVFLADKSVDGPAEQDDKFSFTRKYLGLLSNDEFMTLDDWVNSSVPATCNELLLQMDIEGFEYEVVLGCSDALLRRFRIMVIEFHGLDQLCIRQFFRFASRAFEKLLQFHTCVHIHPHNCCGTHDFIGLTIPRVAEFTFLRNDRITHRSYANTFPHPLDRDNLQDRVGHPHLVLPKCWWGNGPLT
jgi:hypothetical protein